MTDGTRKIPMDVQQTAVAGDGFSGRALKDTGSPTVNGDLQNGHRLHRTPGLVIPEFAGVIQPDLSIERFVQPSEVRSLGRNDIRVNVPTILGPFHELPEYKTDYPQSVVGGLGTLYEEYQAAFVPLVERNREWPTDYQHAMGPDGTPKNFFVQIDMTGLPQGYLDQATHADKVDVRDSLRNGIYEIENSLAMYGLLGRLFSEDGQQTAFDRAFREGLDEIRERTDKSVALLAVTEEKTEAMRQSEFGKREGEELTQEEVKSISGFDAFFGPQEFVGLVERYGEDLPFVFYARTSEPVSKLKDPRQQVESPLLADDRLRRILKAHAITFNIDNPAWEPGDPRRINDTKAYAEPLGMAMRITSPDDVFTTTNGTKGQPPITRLTDEVAEYLIAKGVDPALVAAHDVRLRLKPEQGAYGCYGHVSGSVQEKDFRSDLRRNMARRGGYVLQQEMPTPEIIDAQTGEDFMYIDRVFMRDTGEGPEFMFGFRSLMPLGNVEARKGRVHGNGDTRWAPISETQTAA